MKNSVQSIALEKLIDHPDNPNRMSKTNFAKLLRNIERAGRYEPLVIRPHPDRAGCYQIINGHHRRRALAKLGYKTADAVVWDIDDKQADILLATLNRLAGSDILEKKLTLLYRLNNSVFGGQAKELAKLIPQTAKQIERLSNFKPPAALRTVEEDSLPNPLVFFVSNSQKQTIEDALSLARQNNNESTNAAKKAAALWRIAKIFLDYTNEKSKNNK